MLLLTYFVLYSLSSGADGNSCLSVHFSRSETELYLPYIEAYIEATTELSSLKDKVDVTVFLATHDYGVLEKFLRYSNLLDRSMIRIQQPGVLMRSRYTPDISKAEGYQTHRLNSEVLTHIFLLSKCDFLIHGNYVVSEAAIYINPLLRNHSINVDLEDQKTPQEFAKMVRKYHTSGR
jgi:hypothetical protein